MLRVTTTQQFVLTCIVAVAIILTTAITRHVTNVNAGLRTEIAVLTVELEAAEQQIVADSVRIAAMQAITPLIASDLLDAADGMSEASQAIRELNTVLVAAEPAMVPEILSVLSREIDAAAEQMASSAGDLTRQAERMKAASPPGPSISEHLGEAADAVGSWFQRAFDSVGAKLSR